MLPTSNNGPAAPAKIGFVVPRYGLEILGGAERLVRGIAEELHARGHAVEVLTTCTRDIVEWSNEYPAGETLVNGVPVRRFEVDQLDIGQVYRTMKKANEGQAVPYAEQRDFIRQSINSQALYHFLRARQDEFLCFVFAPYLFGTTYWGVQAVPDKALLLPCLHDEPYARYGTYRWMFRQARRALANSPAERELALRLYDLPGDRVVAAGEGIDLAPRGDGAAFRARRGLSEPLLMYAGRADHGKNMPLLLSYLREYWARRGTPLKLIRTGRDPMSLPPAVSELVLDLGDVPEQERHDAYAAADIFVQPSVHESFSIVLMQAWLQGTPALVHAGCAVTRQAAEESGGGLWFADFGEFAAALDLLLADAALRQELGARGREYVLRTCRWEDVARRTIEALA